MLYDVGITFHAKKLLAGSPGGSPRARRCFELRQRFFVKRFCFKFEQKRSINACFSFLMSNLQIFLFTCHVSAERHEKTTHRLVQWYRSGPQLMTWMRCWQLQKLRAPQPWQRTRTRHEVLGFGMRQEGPQSSDPDNGLQWDNGQKPDKNQQKPTKIVSSMYHHEALWRAVPPVPPGPR